MERRRGRGPTTAACITGVAASTIALLVAGSTASLSAADDVEQRAAGIWFGGRVETGEFSVTVPSDWVAVEPAGDHEASAQAIAERLAGTEHACERPDCEVLLSYWLDGEQDARLAMIGPVSAVTQTLLAGTTQCRIDGPGPASQRAATELAYIAYEAFARSDLVQVSAPPRGWSMGSVGASTFDYTHAADGIAGSVYIFSDGERAARLTCHGPERPVDSWRSLADTFELRPQDETAIRAEDPSDEEVRASDLKELQAMLPVWVGGRALSTHSHRGLEYLRAWSPVPEEQLERLASDPAAVEAAFGPGVALDDLEFAVAGRSSTSDPAYFVTALRIRGLPARLRPLPSPAAGGLSWTARTFGTRTVRTDRATGERGAQGYMSHYVYDVGDVRFIIITDDEEWATEAIARLRPDRVVEDAGLLVTLPSSWQGGYSPTVPASTVASAYADGVRVAAHDAARIGQPYIPTLEVFQTEARLDGSVSAALERWASTYPPEAARGRTITAIERITLPSGEALRLQQSGSPPDADFEVAETRYLIAGPAGVFDLLFSVESSQLPEYEAVFEAMAASFLAEGSDPDAPLARLARGETSRTELEQAAGGYGITSLPTPPPPEVGSGPVVRGRRLAVPTLGLAVELPADWYGVDVTHPRAASAMRSFDDTTRELLAGRLLPANPLMRGNLPYTREVGHLTQMALAEVVESDPDGVFGLFALAPIDGVGAQHECVVYAWPAEATTPLDEARATLALVQEDGAEARLEAVELPAGSAAALLARSGTWEFTIYTLLRDGLAYQLECGDDARHDDIWRGIAESLEFTASTE